MLLAAFRVPLCSASAELTEKPDIHVHEPLVSGLPANLTCSLPGACAQTRPEFSWSGEMLGPRTHNSPELSLTPGPQDHGRNLSCRVRLQSTLETLETTIRLNVTCEWGLVDGMSAQQWCYWDWGVVCTRESRW